MNVTHIGTATGFSSMYSSISVPHIAFIQVSQNKEHRTSTFAYESDVRSKLHEDFPEISSYFQTGGLIDAVVNLGLPAPIEIQVSGRNLQEAAEAARSIAKQIQGLSGVGDVLTPQDVDYPGLRLQVDREMAGRLGLSSREVVDNVITALSSNAMIAPNYWDDPKSGNSYMLAVQYPEHEIKSLSDLEQIPIHSPDGTKATNLGAVVHLSHVNSPTEVDHYQLRRVIDIYVSPKSQDLGGLATRVDHIIAQQNLPEDLHVAVRGSVEGM